MESSEFSGTSLTVKDVETDSEVQISVRCLSDQIGVSFCFGKENNIDFTLSTADFESFVEFLTFNQTRLAITFKQPDGQYMGLSKRRENYITEMTFEAPAPDGLQSEARVHTISLEQSSINELTDFMMATLNRIAGHP